MVRLIGETHRPFASNRAETQRAEASRFAHLFTKTLSMYLVTLSIDGGGNRYLFFWTDPRRDGCTYPVIEGADFIDLPPRDDFWKWAARFHSTTCILTP